MPDPPMSIEKVTGVLRFREEDNSEAALGTIFLWTLGIGAFRELSLHGSSSEIVMRYSNYQEAVGPTMDKSRFSSLLLSSGGCNRALYVRICGALGAVDKME